MRLAILEDDLEVGVALMHWLEAAGHHCHHFMSGKAIIREATRESFDLFILDWQLPDVSGADVLKWLREKQNSTAPILFVTIRDSEQDIVAALNAGADDYMVKPVRRMELLARVEALLRRVRPKPLAEEKLDLPPYHIDFHDRLVKIDDEVIEMTDKEFDLTAFLFRNIGRLLSRGHITESVWGHTADVHSRTVDTHMSRVRKKLDLGVHQQVKLVPVYNFGYRLEQVHAQGIPSTQ